MKLRTYSALLLYVSLACIATCFVSCNSCKQKEQKLAIPVTEQDTASSKVLSETSVIEMIDNMASPVETAELLKKIGVPFAKKYLAQTTYADNYFGNSKKAFGIGIYGADLGYINIYNKTSYVLDYITVIKNMADAIDVGQFFDFSTLKQLASNNSNMDSLIFISLHSFNRIDSYLRTNNRGNLSSLIVAGVWVEGLYLATQVAKQTKNKDVIEKIGEQKIILNNLLILLDSHKKDKLVLQILKDLRDLANLYNEVQISIQEGEAQVVEENGRQVVIQKDESIVKMSEEQLNAIIEKVEIIRNRLIKS